jgi:hypothetical protein
MQEQSGGSSKKSLVDDVIERYKAKTVGVETGAGSDGRGVQYRKLDDSGEGESPLGWEDFIADAVFENIPKMVEDDVELCKTVNSYVKSIRFNKGIPSDAARNGRSFLWFELLRTVGWLDEFLSKETVPEPLTKDEFTRLTGKWASDTGMDWRTWFQLLCYLRSAKLTMITNASTKTLEELDPNTRSYRLIYALANISSNYAKSAIRTLRVGAGAPFSEGKVTNEQWSRIQRMVLTMYNVLPNPRNLETLNHLRPSKVDGLSLDALQDFLSSFYYNSLALHTRGVSLTEGMLVNGDRVFIDHMLSVDLQNYKYISPDHRTQNDADLASADFIAMSLVPSEFRMSETFIVNAFKNDRVRLLVPGGVEQLAGLGIDSEELFDRVLEVVGTDGRMQFMSEISGSWEVWLDNHVETLDEKSFDEKKKVIDSNPNTIALFSRTQFRQSVEANDAIGVLENVITTEKTVADEASESALELLDKFFEFETITLEQYLGVLYKGIELKNKEVRMHILDDEGRSSDVFLSAVERRPLDLKNILLSIARSFPIEDVVLPLFKAVELEDAQIEKEVVQAILKETKVFTTAYSDPEQYHDYEYALEAQREGFIERAELIELISMALRTGRITYDSDFNKLAFEEKIFTAQELSVLFAAQRKDDATFIDSTFKVLYLAMSKAPEDTAFLIRNFLVVQSDAGGDKMDTDDAKSDPTKSQMVVTSDDYDLLKKLYLELTGKTLFG